MYPEFDVIARAAGPLDQGYGLRGDVRPPSSSQVQEAISRAEGVCNLLGSTNEHLEQALGRLMGGVPVRGQASSTSPQEQPSGDLGVLMAVLDRLYNLASVNSDLSGGVARI